MLQKLRELETTMDVASEWESVYTGFRYQQSHNPAHRDTTGNQSGWPPSQFNRRALFPTS